MGHPSITIQADLALERVLSLEIVRVTERAAVSAARLTGRGNEKAADQAAVDAMRRELNKLPIDGTVVIGEGERDEAPMLFIGETVGNKHGPKVDIAVDPLEGTTLCAKNMPGAIATMAMAEGGTLLNAPGRLHGKDRDRARAIPPASSIWMRRPRRTFAGSPPPKGWRRTGSPPSSLIARAMPTSSRACARPERQCGSSPTAMWRASFTPPIRSNTGIDIYMGIGGAPEGVLAAAALRCIGGQMQCRLVLDTEEKRARAAQNGHHRSAQEI